MLKVRLLLSVLFTNIFVLNSQYIKILINLDNSYLDSIEVTEDYRLDYYDNQYYLSNSINYLLLNGSDFKLIEYNDYAYLFYNSDDKYNLSIYNLSLKEISKTVIIESNITSSVVLNGNGVNLLYNYNDDIYLKTFGETIKEKKFEGELKEEVLDCVYYDNYYYMVVKKDKLTGGDFGYGGSDGCKVILKLDSDFNVIKYNTINLTNDFYKLEISNGLLYLVFDNKTIEDEQIINNKDIYLFDLDFNYINKHSLVFNNIIIGQNNLILTINNDNINVYDNLTFDELYHDTINGIKSVLEFDRFLYFKLGSDGYIIDAMDLHQFKNINFTNKYLDYLDDVQTLYGKAILVNKNYLEYYDENVFGKYNLEVEYKTSYNVSFLINTEVVINAKANVTNDLIYPAGYRLDYNGYGELDGINIVNNYPVNKEGKHTLVLKGVNEEDKIINFYVSNDQIEFITNAINEGIELNEGDEFTLEYDIDKDINITDIDIIGSNIKSYSFDNKKLKIVLNDFPEDSNEVFIHYIEYEEVIGSKVINNKIYINDLYTINIKKLIPSVSLTEVTSDYNFKFEAIDYDNTIRGIELLIISPTNNYQLYYPIEKGRIILSNLPKGLYQVKVNLIYERITGNISSTELLMVEANIDEATYFGDIVINSKNDNFTRFSISLSKDIINKEQTKVSIDNNDIYYSTKKSPLKVIIASLVFLIIGFIITFFVYRFIIKKRVKKYS